MSLGRVSRPLKAWVRAVVIHNSRKKASPINMKTGSKTI
jgi:hypothetical protein